MISEKITIVFKIFIAGAYDSQVPDAEMIRIVSEILSNEYLNLGEFNIKINDRNILDGLLIACGVTEEQVRPACSAVDKLDKMCWEGVRQEMVEEKNISPEAADNIGKYVLLKGSLGEDLKSCDAWKLLEQFRKMFRAFPELFLIYSGTFPEIFTETFR